MENTLPSPRPPSPALLACDCISWSARGPHLGREMSPSPGTAKGGKAPSPGSQATEPQESLPPPLPQSLAAAAHAWGGALETLGPSLASGAQAGLWIPDPATVKPGQLLPLDGDRRVGIGGGELVQPPGVEKKSVAPTSCSPGELLCAF